MIQSRKIKGGFSMNINYIHPADQLVMFMQRIYDKGEEFHKEGVPTEAFEITLGDPDVKVEGKDITIVEDIVETSHSMNYLLEYLKERKPASVAICTLFYKPEKFLHEYKIDYVAMPIGNEFIVGYGLDYNQIGRNLKDIYVLDED